MPVDTNRHHTPEDGQEILPQDFRGDLQWVCQNAACGQPQVGRPENGCQYCGAGKPGTKAALPPPFEEAFAEGRPLSMGPQMPKGGSFADRVRASQAPATSPDTLRQVIRDELQAVLGGLQFSPKERNALLQGLAVVQVNYELLTAEEQAEMPSREECAALAEKIRMS